MSRSSHYRYDQTKYRRLHFGPAAAAIVTLVILGSIGYLFGRYEGLPSRSVAAVAPSKSPAQSAPSTTPAPQSGQIIGIDSVHKSPAAYRGYRASGSER